MRKLIFSIILSTVLISVAIITGCRPSTPEKESARDQVKQAKLELQQARKAASAEEWKAFKDESELKIKNNGIRIAEFKAKIKLSGKELDEVYEKRIDALEQQNKSMKARISDFETDTKSDWQAFKREFNHDMDELGNSLKDFSVDNRK
jgi:predicted  nucleic acid-binding Zn-ribbon protein